MAKAATDAGSGSGQPANKSEAIRGIIAQNPKFTSREIIAQACGASNRLRC